jgi:hypothetical protein
MIYQKFDGYGSHIPILESIRGLIGYKSILEFGGGDFSTRYFMGIPGASVSTIESQNYDWYQKLIGINHNTLWIPDHSEVIKYLIDLLSIHTYDIIFLDTHQDLRYKLANIAKDYCKVIVLHDSETSLYRYHEIPVDCTKLFWADFILHRPWTSILTRDKSIIDHVAQSIPCIMYDDFSGKLYTADI